MHGISHGENCIKGHNNDHSRSAFEPQTFSVYGHSSHPSVVVENPSPCQLVLLSLSWLNKPAVLVKNTFESPIGKGALD